jgi:DNA-binding transcriptional regulator LsrR (DeoR family)
MYTTEDLIKIAELYYINGMSQQDIADLTHQSRTNISRLLKICVDEGIIEFRIMVPTKKRTQLASELEKRYGLMKAVLVPSGGSPNQLKGRAAIETCEYLKENLRSGMLIGLAWGNMIYEIVRHFSVSIPYKIDVIQCIGGTNPTSPASDGQMLTKMLEDNFNGTAYSLNAPMIVSSPNTKDILLSEPMLKEHFRKMAQADVALLGIGSNENTSSLICSGNLSKREIYALQNSDVVADICGSGIDINGKVCDTILKDRIIAIDMDTLKKIPLRIGSAVGKNKVKPILSVLRGHYINVLVTDEETAKDVLSYK